MDGIRSREALRDGGEWAQVACAIQVVNEELRPLPRA